MREGEGYHQFRHLPFQFHCRHPLWTSPMQVRGLRAAIPQASCSHRLLMRTSAEGGMEGFKVGHFLGDPYIKLKTDSLQQDVNVLRSVYLLQTDARFIYEM